MTDQPRNKSDHITDRKLEQVKADQDALYRDVMELSDKAIKKLSVKKSDEKRDNP